jgi:phosphatidate cytidylyltransferase
MSLLEFYRLFDSENAKPQKALGIVINLIIFLPTLIQNIFQMGFNLLPLVIILPFVVFIRELFLKNEKPLYNIGSTLLGNIYISIPLFCFYLISFQGLIENYQYVCILGYLFILWMNDIGGYFIGKYFGKHKLFERISPKKTWEGFFGGAVFALLMSWIVFRYFGNLSLSVWMTIGVIIIIFGSLGDLVESMFKRSVQLKDSGTVLPGHGGFLDRFDGLFISAPFVYFYLQMWR